MNDSRYHRVRRIRMQDPDVIAMAMSSPVDAPCLPAAHRGPVPLALDACRRLALFVGAAVLSGCFSYLPVESPTPGEMARLRVPVSSAVSTPGAPPETTTVEGMVLEAGDTIVIEVQTRREIGAYREFIQENTYRIARGDLVSVEVRELSRSRSAGLGAAIVLGAGVLAWMAVREGSDSAGDLLDNDNTPSGFTIRIPIR